jgi:hypothetical protein
MVMDWHALKVNNPISWYRLLAEETSKTLALADLSALNEIGCYHLVRNYNHFSKMQAEWGKTKTVPAHWISKGLWPGIWTALFSPENTFSRSRGQVNIVKFLFMPGYRIFDANNPKHMESWLQWPGRDMGNPWKDLKNDRQMSLEQRMDSGYYLPMPNHRKFYEQNKFGAAIGYSDYVSAVILLEESVLSAEFSIMRK